MKITYLENSGFSVELDKTLLVFDECNGKADKDGRGIVTKAQVEVFEKSYLFLSHSHHDHWCKEVLALPFSEVFLSDEFPKGYAGHRLSEGQTLTLPNLTVRAFGSTDLGVSFLVDAEGKRIFHAGDYNLWHWEDESTENEIQEATDWFERILTTLAPFSGTIDLCFFPVDPRMGKNTARGAHRIQETLKPSVFVPMHFMKPTKEVTDFAAQYNNVLLLNQRGQTGNI